MYRATTPTHTFKLNIETDQLKTILVTYKQGNTTLEKRYENGTLPSGMTLSGKNVIVKLTQEETLMFDERQFARVQLRALSLAGDAYASQKFSLNVNGVFNEEILV